MKKMLNIIAALTAVSISMSTAGVAAIAAEPTDDNVSDSYTLENGYDINNENYRKKVDSLGEKIAHEEEFVAYLNEFIKSQTGDNEDSAVTHVYNVPENKTADGVNNLYIIESIVPGTNKKARKFEQMIYYWGKSDFDESSYGFLNYDEVFLKYSVDEMNAFLEEENLKAKITEYSNGYKVVYYSDTSEENVVSTFLALNKKFGAEVLGLSPNMEYLEVFYDDSMLGDANIDGEVNVRDCAFIASKLAEGLVNELPGCSDYNGDGKVDVRDAAALANKLA